jgi:ABC-type polysaccharide/polyol phosphate transport system ATPase subunit
MKAKLYLAIVTAMPADLIILDEIFGATDIFFAEKLSIRIKNMIKNSGAAIIVSHNMDDIKNFCNKLIVLSNKKIIFNGEVNLGINIYEKLKD